MRLKHVKGASECIEASRYVLKDPCDFKNIFTNNYPLHVEIGMGKGDFIIKMASNNPNINFIGIEKYDSVIVRAIQKLETQEIPNLRLIRMDANEIDKIFTNEIDLIYLNFSDPWPKERHEKRRLTSKVFLDKYDKVLKTKHIIMKTDNRKLFEYSVISFTNYGYKINSISLNLYQDDIKDNIETEYEKKFVAKGLPIYKIDVSK